MEKRQYLSLGSWPHVPGPYNQHDLSPITKRILNQVHLTAQDILPLAFTEFCKERKGRTPGREGRSDSFEFENERRSRQAVILADIRGKYILGEDYNTPSKKSKSKPKSLIKSRELSRNSSHTPTRNNEFSNVKVMQALSRIKSQRKAKICSFKSPVPRKRPKNEDSDYFIHFNPHREKASICAEKHPEEESTKGNEHKKSSIIEPRHSQYGNFIFAKNTRLRSKKDHDSTHNRQEESKELCHELLTTMERWEQLDREHLFEMRKMKDLSQREKERLSKMQEIEKNQMRTRIKRIKSRLSSQSHRL